MKMFTDDAPIYIQLRKHIIELILNLGLKEEDSLPSLRTMAKDYSLNPITISNALSALIEEGILYKKRGLGFYVSEGARRRIIESRREDFFTETLVPTLNRAKQLEFSRPELSKIIDDIYGGNRD
ncbi:MAG: GntR family transcriptional regulator [Candidatus Cloacimonadota bacterium]